MVKEFRTGIVITGDAKGGVKAVKLTDDELKKLNTTQEKGQKAQRKSRKETKKSSASMKEYAGKLGLVSAAGTLLATVIGGLGIASVVKETVAATRETNAWANAVGVSTQELQAAEFATQSLGLSQGKIADIYKDTAEKIADAYLNGGGEAAEVLEHLNLTAAELVNLSPDKQLLAIAGGLDAVGSNAAKIQILESMASDASLLIPLLENDAEKFKALKQEAIDSGAALSALDTAKISLLGEEFRKLSATSTGFGNELTVALTPVIRGVSQEMRVLIKEWGGLGNVSTQAVDAVVTGLGFILDVGQDLQQMLKLSEIGWLKIGKVSVDAFLGAGEAGVELLNIVLQPVREVIGTIIEGYGYLIQAAADISGDEAWKKAASFALGYADAIKTTQFEMQDFIDLQKDIEDQLAKSNAELVEMVKVGAPSDEINEWLEKQRKEVDALAKANVDATKARQKLTSVEGAAVDKAKELKEAVEPIVQIYEDTATSIRGSFSGAFRDALDGQNSFSDRMKNVFKDMLADMATLTITRPIIIPLVSSVSGLLGVSGAAQAGVINQLGGGVAAGAIGASYAGFSGEQGALLAAQTSGFGADGAVLTAQAGGGSGFMEAAGAILGAGFMGYMAGGIAADIFNVANPKMAQNLTAVGAMIAGPWGAAIGFIAGSLFNGKWKTTSSGVELSVRGGQTTGRTFQQQSRKGGLFGSSASRTNFGYLDKELQAQLQQSFGFITDSFVQVGDALERDAQSVLNNFTSTKRVQLQGLSSTEASQAIEQWLKGISDELALQLLPSLNAFMRAGEGAADTLLRVTNALTDMQALNATIADQVFVLQNSETALAGYTVNLKNINQSISDILNSITETTDPTLWFELERQLYDQTLSRYKLEQEMLTRMKASVQSVITDISGLRGSISGDVNNIVGARNFRNPADIQNDINSIAPDNVPVFTSTGQTDYSSLISNALANISSQNVIIANTESQLTKMKRDFGWLTTQNGSLTDDENFNQGVEFWINTQLENIGLTLTERLERISDTGFKTPTETIYLNYNEILNKQALLDSQNFELTGFDTSYTSLVEEQDNAQTAAANALVEFNEALDDYVSLTSDQVAQLQRLRGETLRYYTAQKQLADVMRGAANNLAGTIDRLKLSSLSPGARLDNQLSDFRGLAGAAESATGFDLANISTQLNNLVDPLLSDARNLFASGGAYQDIYNEIINSLTDVQARLIDGVPVNYELESLGVLNSIDGLLGTLQGELSSAERAIVNAIDLSRVQTVGALEDIRSLLGRQENIIVDGSHADGLAYVPFNGYKAETHLGEGIIDAGTMSGLRKYGIPINAGNSEGGSGVLLPMLNRIREAIDKMGGDLNLQVITPDGRVLKEETILDIQKRTKRGEIIVHARGVSA